MQHLVLVAPRRLIHPTFASMVGAFHTCRRRLTFYRLYSTGQFMNPGPAPRPPTGSDRPRLNLTPSTNVPGSMANTVISPIRSTATSTYTGSTISLPIARQQSNTTDGSGGVAVKKEGWASVKEGKTFIQPWKQKYLILRKESLDFHKREGDKVSYTVYLRDVVNVGRVEAAGTIFEIKRRTEGNSTSPGDDDGEVRTLQIKVKGDDDLYEWIDYIYGACPGMGGVSNPTNFSHAVHVGFDPQTGEFVGLPPEWSKLLNSSAITKEDYERNPEAVFEVLDFYSDLTKRADNPNQFPSLTPTPPASSQGNKQLGYGTGNGVAPPRPAPPAQSLRNNSNTSPGPGGAQRRPTLNEQQSSQRQPQSNYASQDALRDEQRKKQMDAQRQREEEQNRREMEAYNASLPKSKMPLAKQEVGGYSSSPASQPERYNPSRAAPPAPKQGGQPTGSLRAQRPAPPAPGSNGTARAPPSQSTSSSTRDPGGPPPRSAQRTDSPSGASRYQASNQGQQPRQPQPPNQAMRGPAPVKPLNVPAKPSQQQPADGGIKAAEAALTAKPSPSERQKDVRMSTMSESEVMAKLKEAVSRDDPNLSYSKQKKIGQGASGSVYVAKIKETAIGAAREVLRIQGPRAQVAIKQMDLAHQPRKELIVNEIMVMKDSSHKNIVSFVDAFLRNNNTELWVIMEFMEGGALTDVIDNNPSISEEQISTICHEVRFPHLMPPHTANACFRPAAACNTFTPRTSFIEISRVTMFFLMHEETSKLVRICQKLAM